MGAASEDSPPNPLRVDKIEAILSVGVSKNAVSMYKCVAGDGQSVRRLIPHLPHCAASFPFRQRNGTLVIIAIPY